MSLLLFFKSNPVFVFGSTSHGPAVAGAVTQQVAPVPAPALARRLEMPAVKEASTAAVPVPRAPEPVRPPAILTTESTGLVLPSTTIRATGWSAGSSVIGVTIPITSVLRQSPAPSVTTAANATVGTTNAKAMGSSRFSEVVIIPLPTPTLFGAPPGSVFTHGNVTLSIPRIGGRESVPGMGALFGIFFAMPTVTHGAPPPAMRATVTGSVTVPLPALRTGPIVPGAAGSAVRSLVIPRAGEPRQTTFVRSSTGGFTVAMPTTGSAPIVPPADIEPTVFFFFGGTAERPRTTFARASYTITLAASRVLIDVEAMQYVEIDVDDGGLDL